MMSVYQAAEAFQKVEKGEAIIVDVRTAGEYLREHIEGAKILPLGTLSADKLQEIGDKEIILCCATGNRSGQALEQALTEGHQSVSHIDGGIGAWRRAGLPVKENKSAPLPIMRQVQIIVGGGVLVGTLLALFVNPAFIYLALAMGAGLFLAGVTGFCGLARALALLPYNKVDLPS